MKWKEKDIAITGIYFWYLFDINIFISENRSEKEEKMGGHEVEIFFLSSALWQEWSCKWEGCCWNVNFPSLEIPGPLWAEPNPTFCFVSALNGLVPAFLLYKTSMLQARHPPLWFPHTFSIFYKMLVERNWQNRKGWPNSAYDFFLWWNFLASHCWWELWEVPFFKNSPENGRGGVRL